MRGRLEYIIIFSFCLQVFAVFNLSASGVNTTFDSLASRNEPFIVFYPRKYDRMAKRIRMILDNSSERISSELGIGKIDTIRVYIAGNKEDYRALHGETAPEWSEACSDLRNMRLCIDMEAVLREQRPVRTVITHELSHLLFAQRVRGTRCPTWFLEGLAMRQSGEWGFSDHWHFMVSVWKKNLPDLEDLRGRFPKYGEDAAMAYRISYIAVKELFSERPEDLMTLTAFTRDLGDFKRAFILTFGKSPLDFAAEFHATLGDKYRKGYILAVSAPFWAGMVILFLIAYSIKRYRARAKIRRWEVEEMAVRRQTDMEA
ncbi:MAG TPA: hypothetical protein VKO43_04385 [Candidatus Krumholzibacteriaceae bacterium]|nr:hypothetical protein [Candidatus Krumholzibacteriaceae bacterium]